MTAIVSSCKNLISHREYKNDWDPQLKEQLQRIAMVALPFLSLNRSFRHPISLVLGSLRVWHMASSKFSTHKKIVHTALAVSAVGATVFRHPIGMILITAQDILIELGELKKTIENKDWNNAGKSFLKILNHVFHLALICRGGLELSMLSLMIHTSLHMIKFKKGRWLESSADLLMVAIRLNQLHFQYEQLVRNREIEKAIKRVTVGELHEKWQFPSDHLPVGAEVNGVRIISWNVLNNAYIKWITEKDLQGLKGSLINDLNQSVNDAGLTKRDLFVVDFIKSLTESGQIVALQECSHPFLKVLEQELPKDWQVVRSFDDPTEDQEVILYDASSLTHHAESSGITYKAYPSDPYGRCLQYAQFSSSEGTRLNIFNVHIPGDPNIPARGELAQHVFRKQDRGAVTLVIGDNNFERDEMIEAYQKAGFDDFSLHSPWKTNIHPYGSRYSKAIDHIFIAGDHVSRDLSVNELMEKGKLGETIDLLNGE